MKTARAILILIAMAAAFVAGHGYGRWYGKGTSPAATGKGGRRILYYVDPMHPAYKSDRPGIAPDCGMRLEPVYADEGPSAAAPERKVLHYRDPQQPSYTSPVPGLNPETGNELEPVYEGEPPAGAVHISPEKQQLIGVRYGTVEIASAGKTIRASGKVTIDETRVTRVHPRVEGWVEQVFADYTGKYVRKGQPLLTLYSPEMLASQQEYLLALKARGMMRGSTVGSSASDAESLVEAARRRLELWDLAEAQIGEIERTGKPVRSITVYSPASGYVTARNAYPRQKVGPETEIYALVDLSRVWIVADVFEYEAPDVRVGQAATVTLPYAASRVLPARVTYILPEVDPATRTLKVRLELGNPGGMLKPEMYVDVTFQVRSAPAPVVPVDAVLDSGLVKTVFVDRGNGYLEPRRVETGERFGGQIRIVKGLSPGERIVVSGNFLVDSESQLKSSLGAAEPPPAGGPAPPRAADTGGHQHD